MRTKVLPPDPDDYRDSIVCGDRPDDHPLLELGRYEGRTLSPEEFAAWRRRRAERLWRRLCELRPDDPPPTLPNVEDGQLEALCKYLEGCVAKAMGKG